MAVRAKYHFTYSGHHFTHILVDNGLVSGNIYSAVLFGAGKSEKVVVLVYSASNGAEAVMAVCKNIGHGKFLKSAGSCRLDYTDICNIMGSHGVKSDFQLVHISGSVMVAQNTIGHSIFSSFFF